MDRTAMAQTPHPPRRGAARLLQRFRSDKRGVSAVEFGLVGVPFLGLLLAMFEAAFVLFNAEMVDEATANAVRPVFTGQIQQSGQSCALQKQTFINMICPASGPRPASALPSNFDCSKVIIDLRQSDAMNNLDVSDSLYQNPGGAKFEPAPAGQNNVLRVIYPLPAILPVLFTLPNGSVGVNRAGQVQYGGKWTHMLMGVSVFRTEPYGAGGGSSC